MPYGALITEYGHTEKERLSLATWLSVTWALGFAVGNQIYLFQDLIEKNLGWNSVKAFQGVIVVFGAISALLMLCPVLFIREKDHSTGEPSHVELWSSIRHVFSNKKFVYFTSSDLFYWMALTFIQSGISYFMIALLGLEPSDVSFYMTMIFAFSFACYLPII